MNNGAFTCILIIEGVTNLIRDVILLFVPCVQGGGYVISR